MVLLTLVVIAYNFQFFSIPRSVYLNAQSLNDKQAVEFRLALPTTGFPHEYKDVTEDSDFRVDVLDYVHASDTDREPVENTRYRRYSCVVADTCPVCPARLQCDFEILQRIVLHASQILARVPSNISGEDDFVDDRRNCIVYLGRIYLEAASEGLRPHIPLFLAHFKRFIRKGYN